MDTQAIWLIVLSIATPLAGVVGFAVQLRQVKKTRLENEKLLLEIQALKTKAATAENRIVPATLAQIEKYSLDHPAFSRVAKEPSAHYRIGRKKSFKEWALDSAIVGVMLLLLAYFLFDLYRLGSWVHSKL